MATKKQKRERALARRARMMDGYKRTGLAAQMKDVKHRQRQELEEWQEQHDKKHSWKHRIVECPHCRIELAASRRQLEDADKK